MFFLIPAISIYTIILGTMSIGSSLVERSGRFAHWCARTWSRLILVTTGVHVEVSGLDARTHAIIRLGALLALDAPAVSYQWNVDEAFGAGVTPDEIVGCLIATAPIVGIPRVVSAAPELAAMIGYDIDAALEALPED